MGLMPGAVAGWLGVRLQGSGPGSCCTLAATYDAGAGAADQTMTLQDVDGGPIIVKMDDAGFTNQRGMQFTPSIAGRETTIMRSGRAAFFDLDALGSDNFPASVAAGPPTGVGANLWLKDDPSNPALGSRLQFYADAYSNNINGPGNHFYRFFNAVAGVDIAIPMHRYTWTSALLDGTSVKTIFRIDQESDLRHYFVSSRRSAGVDGGRVMWEFDASGGSGYTDFLFLVSFGTVGSGGPRFQVTNKTVGIGAAPCYQGMAPGSAVASAASLDLVDAGGLTKAFYVISGVTAIDFIRRTDFFPTVTGANGMTPVPVVILQFEAACTLNHNTGAVPANYQALWLVGGAAANMTANDFICLALHRCTVGGGATERWCELWRSVLPA